MRLTVQQCNHWVQQLLPWGERLVEVFKGHTYAIKQKWKKKGEIVSSAVPAAWYYHRRRITSPEDFLPLTPRVGAQHLLGRGQDRQHRWVPFSVGSYLMCPGNVVHSVAADLDIHQEKGEPDEAFDARRRAGFPALLKLACDIPVVANRFGISVFIEVSASGAGIHVWTFFSEAIPAVKARRMLWRILCAAGVAEQIKKGFEGNAKFDAIFPKQDELTGLKAGNLIFLPYFEFALRAHFKRIVPRSIFVDAGAISKYGILPDKDPPVIRLSQFLDGLTRHSLEEVDNALLALKDDGYFERPPGQTRSPKRTAPDRHPGLVQGTPDRSYSRVDWRRFLLDNYIRFHEVKKGILQLEDYCPICGIDRHNAWIDANSGYLKCFSENCGASNLRGGIAPKKWCRLYEIPLPKEMQR